MKVSKLFATVVSLSLAVSTSGTFGVTAAEAERVDGELEMRIQDSLTVYPGSTNTIQPLEIEEARNVVSISFDVIVSDFFSDFSIEGLYGETTIEEKDDGYHVTVRDDDGIPTAPPISVTFTVGEEYESEPISFTNFDFVYTADTTASGSSVNGSSTFVYVNDYICYDENGISFFVYRDHVRVSPCSSEISYLSIPATYQNLPVTEAEIYMDQLKYIECDENNTSLSSYDGVLFNKAQTELICFPTAMQKSAYEIPDTVIKIDENAFSSPKNLTKLTIPDSVTEIDDKAIYPKGDNFLICGKSGSAAEEYAKRHYIAFCDTESNQTIAPSISGTCGDDLTWNLDENGVMTISGTGAMADFDQQKNCASTPWVRYTSYIKEVVVEDGVTSVSNDAFAWCDRLKKVSLPDSLLTLEYQAFYCCRNLTDLTLPKNLQTIGGEAFTNDGFSELTIPESVTKIGGGAFGGCKYIKQMYIPASVSEIEGNVFWNCCEFIKVSEDNQNYSSEKGILYNKDKTEIISIPYFMKDVELAEGVTEIKDWQFDPGQIKRLYIPETVTTIGQWAFHDCTSLSEVEVSPSNPNFQSVDGVLYDADHTLLYYPPAKTDKSYRIIDGTQKIAAWAFWDCSNLTYLSVPASVTEIDSSNICGCKKLCSIDVDEDNPTYSSYEGVVYNKTKSEVMFTPPGLTTLKIPENISSLGLTYSYYNYLNCTDSLQTLILPATVKVFSTISLDDRFQNLTDIYYAGSEADLEISGDLPSRVTVHYNRDTPLYMQGDLNGDGSFSVSDYIICQKYLLGCYQFNQEQWIATDVNGDSRVDVFDLVFMRQGLIG